MMELKKILSTNTFKSDYISLVPHKGLISDFFQYFSEQEIYWQFGIRPPYNEKEIKKKSREPWTCFSKIISNRTGLAHGYIQFIIHNDITKEISLHGGKFGTALHEIRNAVEGWNLALKVCKEELNCINVSSFCFDDNNKAKLFLNEYSVINLINF